MRSNNQFGNFIASIVAIVLVIGVLFVATDSRPVFAAEDYDKYAAVASNCSSIKTQLRQLQRVDSRTRIYLGTHYETVIMKFITPLNLRLVRNNRETLSTVQADFTELQAKFKNDYTEYMRELEQLLNIDCQSEPENFYRELQTVRARRSELRESTENLLALTRRQYQLVGNLVENL